MTFDPLFTLTLMSSKRTLIDALGLPRFAVFKERSGLELGRIKKDAPSIKGSIYASNYQFCLCYIAWYRTLLSLNIGSDAAGKLIWQMNEDLLRIIPRWLVRGITKGFLQGTMKKAKRHQMRSEAGLVPEYDWKLRFRQTDADSFEVDIYECGMLKLGKRYDAMGMFPYVCRMDYLMAHYMGHGFTRTKTLADGNDLCDCHYTIGGSCEWAPEKGFVDRK